MKITRQDWEQVMQKACDIANATEDDGDPLFAVHVEGMLTLLDELEAQYGPQSQILATRADYLDDFSERRTLYHRALDLARKNRDTNDIGEIMDSIKQLDEEEKAGPGAGADGPKAGCGST
jgi:fructosamine-3-kinase